MGSLLAKIKEDAQKSSSSMSKFFYVKDGEKKRIRFLNDMEDGLEILFHDSYEDNINVPCQQIFGRECLYCEEEGLRTRAQYVWSVWDYEAKEVKLFMYRMNNCSPIGAIAAMYENYGTLLDRDYTIGCTGKQTNKTFSVIPQDKVKFRNEKAKPFSKKAILEMLDKAYPDEYSAKMKPQSAVKKSKRNNDDDDLELEFTDTPAHNYSNMSPRELYDLCEERGIEAEPKNPKDYYVNLLEEYDANKDDEEVEDEDSWDDEDDSNAVDYFDMSAKELFKLCKERNIEAELKKPEKYYINLLQENDKAHDEWEDEEDEENDW